MVACENDAKWQHQDADFHEEVATTLHNAYFTVSWDEASACFVREVILEYALSADFDSSEYRHMSLQDGQWYAEMLNMEPEVTRYYRYWVAPEYLQPKPVARSFVTTNTLLPTITTNTATEISAITAILHGKTSIFDNYEITERGFYYSLLKDDDFERKQVKCGSGEGYFKTEISALRANATYYYYAYAVNKNGIAYGDTLQFNTLNPYE